MSDKETRSLEEYIDKHADILGRQAERSLKPLHVPGKDDTIEGIEDLLRQPFPAQSHVITSAVRALDEKDNTVIVGQMGTGKTLCSMAVAHLHAQGKPYRGLVLCPLHLSKKWPRELKSTLPDVEVRVIRNWKDALALRNLIGTKPTKAQWYVLARDTAKLSSGWRAATAFRESGEFCIVQPETEDDAPKVCDNEECPKCHGTGKIKIPVCPECGGRIVSKTGMEIDPAKLDNKRHFCNNIINKDFGAGGIEDLSKGREPQKDERRCGAPLFQFIPKPLRWAPSKIIKDQLPRGFFDYLIADECHEGRSSDSAQGHSLGSLISSAKKSVLLTGTISTGSSESLRPMLFRTRPGSVIDRGFEWSAPTPFNEKYGRIETVIREKDYPENRQSKGSVSKSKKVVPGIMPTLFSDFLLESAVFLTLDDVSASLPPYHEQIITCEMEGDQLAHYELMQNELRKVVQEMLSRNDRRLLGPMLTALLAWPDYPYEWGPIGYTERNLTLSGYAERYVKVWQPASLDPEVIYPKEKELIDLCVSERDNFRKSWVYVQYTDKHDVAGRLQEILEKRGLKVAVMRAKVPPAKREAWIAEHAPDHDVIISHPKLVETGVDFFDKNPQTYNIPTIVFYECGYQPITLRQAAARAFRIGQEEECRVYYLHYHGMQEQALSLMGRKINQSQALEGKFSAEGLAALDDDSMEVALARSLVENINDSAARHWRKIGQKAKPVTKPRGLAAVRNLPNVDLRLKVSPSLKVFG